MNEFNSGIDAIDSTDYVMKSLRAIKAYPDKRIAQVESTPISEEARGSSLQQEKAFKAGYIAALNEIKCFIKALAV